MLSREIDVDLAQQVCEGAAHTKLEKQARKAFAQSKEAFNAGRLEEAARSLHQAIKFDPSNPLYQRNLGLVHLRNQMSEMALATLEKAVDLDPLDPKSRLHYGKALMAAGQVYEARKELRIALAIDPHDEETAELYQRAAKGWQIIFHQSFHPGWFLLAFVSLVLIVVVVVGLIISD
ncbi:MAG: tetratricopeptide repeat protein, partial [Candidatus Alcyoniella australis]|nr:tetratricopeptide repeat protein [Candidatus Alcyoniella australis]